MSDQNENNFFTPILSAISGIGAIVTSVSPIIFSKNNIFPIFIDPELTTFASIIAVVIVIITIWMTSSISAIMLFNNKGNPASFNLKLIIMFLLSLVFFYLMNVLVKLNAISIPIASLLQLLSYLLAFLFLAMIVGFLLRDSINNSKREQIEATKMDRIKELLIKTGLIKLNFKLLSIENYVPQQGEFSRFGSKQIRALIDGKEYYLIASSDFSLLQHSAEIPKQATIVAANVATANPSTVTKKPKVLLKKS